ncbi:pentapeptide repeat-containing protein [Nostoc sp.]|uniref:pentapeptide repeat-containing protein n=1 Tax=Nostoc sp. TaxID=1180 RepID=UPI002FF895F4
MPPDYSGQNLRGRSFKGQNLRGANFSGADITGANFSGADIRGANFANATLKDAHFTDAKAGLQRRWVIGLLIVLLLLSALSGFASEYVMYALYRLINPTSEPYLKISGAATLAVLIFFFFITIYKNLDTSLSISMFVSAIASSAVIIVFRIFTNVKANSLSGGVSFAGAVAAAIVDAGVIDSAIIICGMNRVNIYIFILFACVVGSTAFCTSIVVSKTRHEDILYNISVVTGIVIISIILLSIYIAWNAMKGDKRYDLIRKIAIAFAATGGTTFYNADLTNAKFTGATLKNTDLRELEFRLKAI